VCEEFGVLSCLSEECKRRREERKRREEELKKGKLPGIGKT